MPGFRFENLLADERVRGVDWLLVEGTTLGASSGTHGLQSEADVEDALVQLARDSGGRLIAVAASGQNVDRLVSCFRAAKRAGRQLVIDPYQAYVLLKLAPLSKNIPQFTWDDVRVSFVPHQVERLKAAGLMDLAGEMSAQARVSSDELAATPGRFLVCTRGSFGVTRLFDKIGADRVALVWSMWSGYWKRDTCALREWAERTGASVTHIHSGGHAWPEDLKRLVEAVEAKETVWVHTDADEPERAVRD